MHKLAETPITIDCFEINDYDKTLEWTGIPVDDWVSCYNSNNSIDRLIDMLEGLRLKYLETKNPLYWKELIRWLPESWLQTRTWTCNYENLFSICKQRSGHKLTEWHQFIAWVETLPYAKELIFI